MSIFKFIHKPYFQKFYVSLREHSPWYRPLHRPYALLEAQVKKSRMVGGEIPRTTRDDILRYVFFKHKFCGILEELCPREALARSKNIQAAFIPLTRFRSVSVGFVFGTVR